MKIREEINLSTTTIEKNILTIDGGNSEKWKCFKGNSRVIEEKSIDNKKYGNSWHSFN